MAEWTISELNGVDFEKDSRYEKIGDSNLAGYISGIFKESNSMADAMLLSNAYSVKFPEGVSGVLTQRKDGLGLLPTIRNPETGKFKGQSALQSLDSAAVASAVMSGLSIVTSQYYLKQINQRLDNIQTKLDSVLQFLYTDKMCEIYAESQLIYGIYKNYKSIMSNSELCSASLNSVQHARSIAEKNIQFYYRDMNQKATIGDKRKQSDIAESIRDDLSAYNQSIVLFGLCCFLEITLSQNYDKDYLNYMNGLMRNHGLNHDIIISKIQGKLDAVAAIPGGLLRKTDSELIDLTDSLEQIIGESSPVKEFAETIKKLTSDVTSKSEYIVASDGSVYKKKTA